MVIDDRTGSGDLAPLLKRRGVEVELGRLEFGDVSILGNGPEGCPTAIGIEVKRTLDALACMCDGRFAAHQLPGLVSSFPYRYLLVEGRYRADMHSGVLQVMNMRGQWVTAAIGQRQFMYSDFNRWLITMEVKGGIRIVRTYDRNETVQWLSDCYHWWTDKEFDQHRSHLATHDDDTGRSRLVAPSLVRRVAKELPGIGAERSSAVSTSFPTVLDLALADEREWAAIEGIGKITARKIRRAIGHDNG